MPDLAILVSVFDENLDHVRACLESVHRTLPPRWSGEVILVDHTTRADPGLPTALPRPGWRTLRAATRNDAVATARGSTLCFLDAGTMLLPGWLPPMVRLLDATTTAGCIGNIQREPYSGLIDHAGIGFDADGLPRALGRTLALLPRETSDRRAAVSMACCLVRRKVFERLGGFDDAFRGPLGEVDFCLRAAEAGYRHFVANRSMVYRYDHAASMEDDPDLPLYRARWGDRARRCHARRASLRNEPVGAPFSAERWEMVREDRRLLRQTAAATRAEGCRYLSKHWHRPWRYNVRRVSRALVQALAPPPAPLPRLPDEINDTARPDDGWLFDPPPQP